MRLAVLGGLAGLVVVASGWRPFTPSTADLLEAYIKNPTSVAATLGSVADLDAARNDLIHLTPKFLGAPLPKRVAPPTGTPAGPIVPILEQRRRNLYSFALDLAGANVVLRGPEAARMLEWACYTVRRHLPPNDFDASWQFAALAMMEAEMYPDALRVHVGHLESQFPNEPRVLLARALADEQATAPLEVAAVNYQALAAFERSRNPAGASQTALMERAAKSYEAIQNVPALRAEASLRLAHLEIGLHRFDEALASLDVAEAAATDGYTVYLIRLFRGQALEGVGRVSGAEAAYRSALEIGPNAHAATMALATLLFRNGHRDEAYPLLDKLLQNDDPTRDGWWSYWSGDFHLWGLLIARVREYVK